jgi:hypothetical protein
MISAIGNPSLRLRCSSCFFCREVKYMFVRSLFIRSTFPLIYNIILVYNYIRSLK